MRTIMAICTAACLAAGCASVEMSSAKSMQGIDVKGANGKADRMISITASGYYLFDRAPIVCSDVRWNEEKGDCNGGLTFFRNIGGISEIYELLLKIAERENCDLCDVVCQDTTHSKFDLTSCQGWLSAIFNYVEIHASAILVPRDGDVTEVKR